MKKRFTLLVSTLLLTSSIPLHAEVSDVLMDEAGNSYTDESIVCANVPLEFDDASEELEVLILDQNTHIINDVFNVTSNMPDVVFPTNAGDVKLMVSQFNEEGLLESSSPSIINLTIEDCGEQIMTEYDYSTGTYKELGVINTSEYDSVTPAFTVEYVNEELIFTLEDSENYELEYQFIKDNDRTNAKEIKFNNKEISKISKLKSDVLQIKESYTNESGELVSNYYEMELYPDISDYSIREVREFGLQEIEGMDLVDWQILIWTGGLFIFYFLVNTAYRKQKKRYRKHQIREMRLKEKNES